MDAVMKWVDARERLPKDGMPVAAATTGRYPPEAGSGAARADGEDFWLVLPMYFTSLHFAEDGTEHRDCFVDHDRVVRLPYGGPSEETVTHWAQLPTLPGMKVHQLLGPDARAAVRDSMS
ncbi:hypothetical protein GCM10009863_47470 [Streptomyces axinellae]|uniref:Amine oxidase n=2 Tax=Streptomyces axinellae TaxID=552788 RepID=A0ABP6CS13_9ACTN